MRYLVLASLLVLIGAVNATARTLEAIRQRGALTLCAHPNALPYASKRDAVPGFQVEIAGALAKQLGVSSSPIGVGTTAGAGVDVTAGTLKSFQVGGAKIDNMTVVVADFFTMLSNAIGVKLDGIVGYNFLRNFHVAIDYPGEMLSLF